MATNYTKTTSSTAKYRPGYRRQNRCGVCEKPATIKCIDCKELMCESCGQVHRRQRATKSHTLTYRDSSFALSEIEEFRQELPASNATCANHPGNELRFFCSTCQEFLCSECMVQAHKAPKHNTRFLVAVTDSYRITVDKMKEQLSSEIESLEQGLKNVSLTKKQLQTEKELIENKISMRTLDVIEKIEKEEKHLKHSLHDIYSSKWKTLDEQDEKLKRFINYVKATTRFIDELTEFSTERDLVNCRKHAMNAVAEINAMPTKTHPEENASLIFVPNEKYTVGELGYLKTSGAVAFQSTLVHKGPISQISVGFKHTVLLVGRDRSKNKVNEGGYKISAKVKKPYGDMDTRVSIGNNKDGTYDLVYVPVVEGRHELLVCIFGQKIKDYPFIIFAKLSASKKIVTTRDLIKGQKE